MSREVDQRVVEMEFDNKQFEREAQTSLSTLDKLKKALKFEDSSKGLENLGRAASNVNVGGLGAAVDTVRDKFSTLEVIATGALLKIGSIAVDAAGKIANVVTSMSEMNPENIMAGWNKFENKTTSVATLVSQGYALEEVNAQLDRLNWFTDETSYNFTDMISNIAKFTASGQDLNTSVTAMEGIANWAALSGQNAATASRAMYQLSQAMSKGALRYDDFKSIQNANMDTKEFREQALATAEAMELLKKNADDTYTVLASGKKYSFAEMFSSDALTREQWLSSDVMMDLFNKYSSAVDQIYEYAEEHGITASQAIAELGDQVDAFGLKAFKAAQEAKTWTDVVDATKDAVSTGWMKTFELIIGDYNEAKTLFTQMANDFYDIFAGGAEARNELLSDVMVSGWKKFLGEGISDANDFKTEVMSVAEESGIAIDDIIRDAGSFEESLHSGWMTADILKQSVSNLTERLSGLSEEELKSCGYSQAQLDALVELNEGLQTGKVSAEEYTKSIAQMSGRDNLVQSLWNLRDALFLIDEESGQAIGLIAIFKEALSDVFPPMTAEKLYAITERIRDFTSSLVLNGENADKIHRTFKGLFSILRVVSTFIQSVFRTSLRVLSTLLGDSNVNILDLSANAGDALTKFADWITLNGRLTKAVDKVGDAIIFVVDTIKSWVKTFLELPQVQQAMENLSGWFEDGKQSVEEFASSGAKAVEEFIKNLFSAAGRIDSEQVFAGIGKFVGKINDFFTGVSTLDNISLANVTGTLSEFKMAASDSFDGVTEKLDGINLSFGNFFSTIKEKFAKIKSFIKNPAKEVVAFIDGVADTIGDHMGQILTIGVGGGIVYFMAKAGSFLTSLKTLTESIAAVPKSFAGVFTGLKEMFVSFGKARKIEALTGGILKIAEALLILVGAVAILAYMNESYDLWAAAAVLGAIAGGLLIFVAALAAIEKFIGSVSILSGLNFAGIGIALIGIGAAILMIVGALKIMEDLDVEKLKENMVYLAEIAGGLVVFAAIAGKLGGGSLGSALTVVALAIALNIVAKSLASIGEADFSGVEENLKIIAEVMGLLALVTFAARGVKMGGAITVLALVVGLKILLDAFVGLGEMDPRKIAANLEVFASIFGMFAVVMIASIAAGKHAAQAGVMMMGMAVALLIIVKTIDIISGMSASDIDVGIKVIERILVMFAAIVALSAFAGENASKAGLMLLEMAGAILVLALAMHMMNTIEPNDMDRLVDVILKFQGMMGILIAVSHFAGDAKGTLIGISIAIGVIAASLALLSLIEPDRLLPTAEALGGVMLALALAIAAAGTVKDGKTALATLIPMMLLIAELGAVLASLSQMGMGNMLSVAEGLSLTLIAVAVAVRILADTDKVSGKAFVAAAGLSGLLVVLANAIKIMTGMDAVSAIAYATALSELVLALSVACVILGKVGEVSTSAGIAAAGLTVVILGLAGILILLNEYGGDATQALIFATALSELVLALSAACVLLSIAGAASVAATAGLEMLAVLVVGIGALLAIIGAVNDSMDGQLGSFLDETIPILGQIGYAIGDFIGSIIGGFGAGISSGLPEIGENLSTFFENVQIDDTTLQGVKNFAEAMLILTGVELASSLGGLVSSLADFASGILDFVSGSQSDPFENLTQMAEAMHNFADKLDVSDVDKLEAASSCAQALSDLESHLPRKGGILQQWLGETDLGEFGSHLVSFASALVNYSRIVSQDGAINQEAVEASASAAKVLSELESGLPKHGGMLQAWLGDNDLGGFGSHLASFALALVDYSRIVSKDGAINQEAIQASADAASILVALEEGLPKHGGMVQAWLGDNGLGQFGSRLASFAQALVDYSDIVGDGKVDGNAIKASADAAAVLSALEEGLPNHGGAVGLWFGNSDLGAFGGNLKKFGQAISDYSKAVSGIDVDAIAGSAEAGEALAAITKGMDTIGGLDKIGSGQANLETFGNTVKSFGKDLKDFSSKIKDVDSGKIEDIADALGSALDVAKQVADVDASKLSNVASGLASFITETSNVDTSTFVSVGASYGDGFVSGFKSKSDDIRSAGEDVLNTLVGSLSGKNSNYTSIGSNVVSNYVVSVKNAAANAKMAGETITASTISGISGSITKFGDVAQKCVVSFTNGIRSKTFTIGAAGTSIVTAAISGINLFKSSFGTVGKDCAIEFANGIRSKTFTIGAAGTSIVTAAISGINLFKSSFGTVGKDCAIGFANGIRNKRYLAANAGSSLGRAALYAAKAAVDSHSPSKKFIKLGHDSDKGFAIGLMDYSGMVSNSAYSVGEESINAMQDAISRIGGILDGTLEMDPTIRPVVDLTNVRAGVSAINGMMSQQYAAGEGIFNRVNMAKPLEATGEISAMTANIQNGKLDTSKELTEALNRLEIPASGDTYNINGITYDDGSEVQNAVRALIRATKVERRA